MCKIVFLLQLRENSAVAEQERKCLRKICRKKGFCLVTKNLFLDKNSLLRTIFSYADMVIIGGSGDFSFSRRKEKIYLYNYLAELAPLTKDIIDKGVPVLGVCLGHHYLAHLFGAQVMSDLAQQEFGTTRVVVKEHGIADPLFKNMPVKFLAQQSHEDSIVALPDNLIVLAKSDRCRVGSFKVRGKNVYGVQFHPELSRADCLERMSILGIKKEVNFVDSPVAKRVVLNFLDL